MKIRIYARSIAHHWHDKSKIHRYLSGDLRWNIQLKCYAYTYMFSYVYACTVLGIYLHAWTSICMHVCVSM